MDSPDRRHVAAHPFRASARAALLAALVASTAPPAARAQATPPFDVVEATIASVHAAMERGELTCRGLVQAYLDRIAAYDKNGPELNALVVVNPQALAEADEMDRRFAQGGLTGPLHCVPTIVKDNFETVGLQSAAGSLALAGFVSNRDAFQVRRMKEAGALVLAKSNMAELAFSPLETISSILPGYTRNPYAPSRVTAGSSGGTAAAVAASFGLVGLGSDTGNSIRGPSSHQSLAGIRSTMGLTSRAGVVPLNLLADIAGPMTRTLEDAVRVLDVIAGEDPDDPVTANSRGRVADDYRSFLDPDGLQGARIGVLRHAYERDSTDPEIVRVFETMLADLRRAGATVVDPAAVEGLDEIRRASGVGACQGFRYDMDRWLASHGDRVPVKTLDALVATGRYHPSVEVRLQRSVQGEVNGPGSPACEADAEYRERVRQAVLATLERLDLDAWVYPTWSNVPRLIGDLNTPGGDNSQFYSPTTGFPAINVPMGYTRGGTLPVGVTFFGRAWDEGGLIRLAYGYEQATRHRRPPPTTPPLR